MDVLILDSWQVHVIKKDDKKRPLFSGFIEDQKVLFYVRSFDRSTGIIESESGKLYKLGNVHPAYEKAFPNAKKKLLKKPRKK
jgi:hypothetical protein